MAGDREEILALWIKTESEHLGRQLKEGIDYSVDRFPDEMHVYYFAREQKETEKFVITDTPKAN